MFEPSSVEADTTVTVTLTIELAPGTNEVVVPVPEAFSLFGCTAPAGWLCWTTELGEVPASMTVARNGGEGQTVAVEMELRTPTASGDYAFGDAVLVVTGGFEGGPTTSVTSTPEGAAGAATSTTMDVPGDDPVVGDDQAVGEVIVDEAAPGSDRGDEVVPAIAAALLIAVVLVRLVRGGAARRR